MRRGTVLADADDTRGQETTGAGVAQSMKPHPQRQPNVVWTVALAVGVLVFVALSVSAWSGIRQTLCLLFLPFLSHTQRNHI